MAKLEPGAVIMAVAAALFIVLVVFRPLIDDDLGGPDVGDAAAAKAASQHVRDSTQQDAEGGKPGAPSLEERVRAMERDEQRLRGAILSLRAEVAGLRERVAASRARAAAAGLYGKFVTLFLLTTLFLALLSQPRRREVFEAAMALPNTLRKIFWSDGPAGPSTMRERFAAFLLNSSNKK